MAIDLKHDSPNANSINPTVVGMVGFVWLQPHNCRLYYSYSGVYKGGGRRVNSGSEVVVESLFFDVRIKRRFLEVFVKIFNKQWFQVCKKDRLLASAFLKGLVIRESEAFLKGFVEDSGLTVDFEPVRDRVEVGERSDYSKVPSRMVVDWSDFKKVYNEDKLEWKSWEALEGSVEVGDDVLKRIDENVKVIKDKLVSPLDVAKRELDGHGNPFLCKETFNKLSMFDREQFLDYWLEKWEGIGIRRVL